MDTDIVVIIPCRNEATRLPRQLAALNEQSDMDFRVVVSDNGSTDATALIARNWNARFSGGIDVVDSSDLPGVAHARNAAIRASDDPLILICDGDDAVHPGWVAAMRGSLRDNPCATGPLNLVFPDEPNREAMWNAGSVPTSMGYLPYMPGCNMGFRREVWEAVQGFDETLATGQEDVDFGWRLTQAGFCIAHHPHAVVDYTQRSGLRNYLRQQWRYGRAHARLYDKHRHDEGIRPPASNKTSARWFVEWAKQLPARLRRREGRDAAAGAVFQVARWNESVRLGGSPL
ncbi:glycosyltransferase family 2 protein [Tessaracoccus sp. MC1679]|uniref:glycosyltransferase n=1 Tax=Tessaracoccus sp. MC1679 TaxID=2760313 RepID=UPI001C728B90|nr:glycosyltransferase [Tessaracoccus sp. MC1679]